MVREGIISLILRVGVRVMPPPLTLRIRLIIPSLTILSPLPPESRVGVRVILLGLGLYRHYTKTKTKTIRQ